MEIKAAKTILEKYLTEHLTDPDAKELCDAIKTMLIEHKKVEWLTRDIPGMDFSKIEKALGFRLFVWQKSFILNGEWRQMGMSTARSVRRLLHKDKPLMINMNTAPRERFENQLTLDIKEKFAMAGIETCRVTVNRYRHNVKEEA